MLLISRHSSHASIKLHAYLRVFRLQAANCYSSPALDVAIWLLISNGLQMPCRRNAGVKRNDETRRAPRLASNLSRMPVDGRSKGGPLDAWLVCKSVAVPPGVCDILQPSVQLIQWDIR